MRALVYILPAFFLYQCTALQGADVPSHDVCSPFISTIISELGEVKSILMDTKSLLGEMKNHGQKNGHSGTDILRELTELKSIVAEQKVKLEDLQKQLADKPVVAFSAALLGHGGQTFGGYSVEEILKFRKVFTNVGDAYSHTTGKFTAPVKGVYYFSFSAFANGESSMGVHLRKNGAQIVATYDYNSSHKDVNGANSAVLKLEKGDEVYIGLWSGSHIFDSYNSVSTFSGFLIFPS